MKSTKSSHTGDPLTITLISYPGKDTHLPKTPGNLNGTYNMPKPYSMSTNNEGTSKKGLSCMVQTHKVLEPPLFTLPRLHGANIHVFEPPFL